MKRKSLLFVWSYVFILSTIFISCKDTDNSVFGDDFDFPALTDANTIRFTVNVTGDWRQLNIVAPYSNSPSLSEPTILYKQSGTAEGCAALSIRMAGWTNGNRLGKRSNAES